MHGVSSFEIVADNQFSIKVPSQQNIYNARIIRQSIKGHTVMTLMSEVFKACIQMNVIHQLMHFYTGCPRRNVK